MRPPPDILGIDASPERRPGVPMEWPPHPAEGAHWREPERQQPTVAIQRRVDLESLTPVFGTAQPPHGLSGQLRKAAYRLPEHKASHWMLLLFADRVDVLESRTAEWVRRRAALLAVLGVGLALAAVVRARSR